MENNINHKKNPLYLKNIFRYSIIFLLIIITVYAILLYLEPLPLHKTRFLWLLEDKRVMWCSYSILAYFIYKNLISVSEEAISKNSKNIYDFQNNPPEVFLSKNKLFLVVLISFVFLILPIKENWEDLSRKGTYIYAIITFVSIYTIYLLSLLSWLIAIKMGRLFERQAKKLKENNFDVNYTDLINITFLNKISLSIFYLFIPGGIIISSIPFYGKIYTLFEFGSPEYYIVSLIIIFFVIFIPIHMLSSVIKDFKYNYINKKLLLVNSIEMALMRKNITKQEYDQYELVSKFIEKAEGVKSWPFDFDEIIKIILAMLIAILPSILNIHFGISK